ncbi:MAG TPA: hypothetical protein DIT65_07895 [Cryomorphaceae bacterium]|nr:hypothetical protein [Cryomorphaceae bacterium]|tara:strand:- start:1319 stop:2128 length:810 start_codon:yes stop_codon:yes gene_type:complete
MKKRTQIEAELAQLVLEIGAKTHSEAAKAILNLYKSLALLEAEESIQQQLVSAQKDMQTKLRSRISELQSKESLPEIAVDTPATTTNEEDDDVNQLSLVDVAEEIEKEAAAKAAQKEPVKVHVTSPEEAPQLKEPVLKSREDRTIFQLDDEVAPNLAASEPEEEAVAEPAIVKSASVAEKTQSTEKKSLNDRLAGGVLKFGLNDRIGFVKDLFDGSAEDFNRVVSQLNTLVTLLEAQEFLTTHIAPEYGWENKEETAERFMAALEQRFA